MYNDLATDLLKPTEDDLKEYSIRRGQFLTNPFYYAFARIAEAIATRPAHVPGTVGHARNPSTNSDLSASSDENRHEAPSKEILSLVLEYIIGFSRYPPLQSQGLEYTFNLHVPCAHILI